MHRPLGRAAALAGALALAACGGDGDTSEDAAPTLPPGVAEALARASDEVAASLDAGDGCRAAEEAAELRDAALVAVDEGRVPAELADPLLAAVERLEAQVVCVEVEEPAPPEEEDEGPPGKGKDKDEDKEKDKDNGQGNDGDGEEEDDDDDGSTGETTTETEGEGR